MAMDPNAEYERVQAKYPALRWRDAVIPLAVLAALGIASIFRDISWWLVLGMVCGAIGWEFRKAQLRRNARKFAEGSRPRS